MFHSNGAWYFATRESVAVGPYASRADAEAAAQELVEQLAATHADATRGAVIDAQTAALLSVEDPLGSRTSADALAPRTSAEIEKAALGSRTSATPENAKIARTG
jgi:hypothetical protein